MTSPLPPPAKITAADPARSRKRRPRGPLVAVAAATIGLRLAREFAGQRYGPAGLVVGVVLIAALIIGWRLRLRSRARKQGVMEYSPQMIRDQVAKSELGPATFVEDGTLLGTSILIVNQRSKLIEVNTHYLLFNSVGESLGEVEQIGQTKLKQALRIFTAFDQFFTHHFDVRGADDALILRLTRPAKLFLSRINVFGPNNQFIGQLAQRNVFGKIDFRLTGPDGVLLAHLKAEN